MIKNKNKIKYIANIKVVNINDEYFEYTIKLKKDYYFKLTNTNMVICYNLENLNKIINYGIKWH